MSFANERELKELNELWSEIKKSFLSELSETTLELWFSDLVVYDFNENTVFLLAKTAYKAKIIRENHQDRIKRGFHSFLGIDVNIKIVTEEDAYSTLRRSIENQQIKNAEFLKSGEENLKNFHKYQKEPEEEPKKGEELEVGSRKFPFKFEYTFENFIVGTSNGFAYAACLGVADNPACMEAEQFSKGEEVARTFNPLFIHGPSGLGKTHLLHAIINRIHEKVPTAKILYVTCEDFTNQLINHLAQKSMNEFKEKYRKCDVLLIDDIQFLSQRKSTQEEFFHTFNALYDDNKQIILTSDRPPKEIELLDERIRTRFEWGLIADIQPPNFELRLAIIKKKAEQAGVEIPEDVLKYIAENLQSNIRQLEGAIKKLAALKFLSGLDITFELAKSCILELTDGEEPVSMVIDRIFEAVNEHFDVDKESILSDTRKQEVAFARHVTAYLLKEMTDLSYPKIAKTLKRRNHSTCINSCQIIEKKLASDIPFASEITQIKKEVGSR